jgi:hypothetical protein
MKKKELKNKFIKLPPAQFSNAMNVLYENWDFTNWPNSKEWRLFNAGRETEARSMAMDAQQAAEKFGKVARGLRY